MRKDCIDVSIYLYIIYITYKCLEFAQSKLIFYTFDMEFNIGSCTYVSYNFLHTSGT